MDKKPLYHYQHGDEVHIYWDLSQRPEIGRVVHYNKLGLKLALGDTGRAYEFDYDKSGNSQSYDRFRDRSGRKVSIRNLNKERKRTNNLKDIRL